MSGGNGPTIALQIPRSSFCIGTGSCWPSIFTTTLAALGAARRKVTCPSGWTSGETGRGGSCPSVHSETDSMIADARKTFFRIDLLTCSVRLYWNDAREGLKPERQRKLRL